MTASRLSTAAMALAFFAALTGCGDQKAQQRSEETVANRQAPATDRKAEPTPPARSIMQPSVEPEPSPKQPPLAPIKETIHFAGGGARLDEAAKTVLDRLIANPTTASGGAIVLRGSSDSGGSDHDNFIVSRKRAEAVAAYLEEKGIAPDRLTIIALGEGRPVAPNVNLDGSDNPEGRARNRRVDIAVSPGASPAAADESPGNGTGAGEPASAAK
ncbi:MAG TPA: OmpA family protein [Sphingomicrobium sp.]|nr:OmpA family protein [Sphingomicrobium sp.]